MISTSQSCEKRRRAESATALQQNPIPTYPAIRYWLLINIEHYWTLSETLVFQGFSWHQGLARLSKSCCSTSLEFGIGVLRVLWEMLRIDSNILLDISAIARHSAVVPSWDPLHLWRCGCFNRICDASHHWFWLCSFCRVKVTTLQLSFSLHLFNCSFPCKTSNPMQSFYVCALFDLSLRHWKLRKLMLWGVVMLVMRLMRW
jgi:hypothetical protein